MKATKLGKATAVVVGAATLGLGLGVPAATATNAALTATQEDPTTATYLNGAPIGPNTLVGVGSDTTQDLVYGLSQDLGTISDGTLNLASWTATGTTPLTYRSGGAPATHPNGSGAGFKAIEESIGLLPAGNDSVGIGDVDFARAAGFQGTPVAAGGGVLTEIPFALDNLTFAVPSGSPFLKTNSNAGLKLSDFVNIYTGADTYVDTANGELLSSSTPNVSGDPTQPIQAFLPKPGSGVRQTFLKQLNAINSAVPYGADKGDSAFTAAYPGTPVSPYVGALTPGSTPVQQNDASVLEAAPAGVAAIVPFSAAKFITYHNGLTADPSGKVAGTDYTVVPFDSAVPIGGGDNSPKGAVLPYVDNSGTYVPNSAYKTYGSEGSATLSLGAFNIIPTAAVTNPNGNVKYRALYDTFVGSASKFCLDTATIKAYGFLTDSNCGNTSQTAGVASTSTVTVSNSAAVAGRSSVFTVDVQSTGNGGGAVTITINGTVYHGTIAAGSHAVTFTVPTPAAGTFSYGGGAGDGFQPNLAGVAAAPIASGSYTVAKATATLTGSAPIVSHLKIGTATVKVAATGLVPTGTVNILVKTTTGVLKVSLSGKALSGGKVTVSLGKRLAAGTYYVYASYSGNANIKSHSSVKVATLKVT
ncbi:MAG: hypothetical protein ACTHOG_08840 [Marmoricola sp.]